MARDVLDASSRLRRGAVTSGRLRADFLTATQPCVPTAHYKARNIESRPARAGEGDRGRNGIDRRGVYVNPGNACVVLQSPDGLRNDAAPPLFLWCSFCAERRACPARESRRDCGGGIRGEARRFLAGEGEDEGRLDAAGGHVFDHADAEEVGLRLLRRAHDGGPAVSRDPRERAVL